MEIYHDARVYDTGMITILEIMGRNAGWLTAASALACDKGAGPDLIYLPELPFCMDTFLSDVTAVYKRNGKCIAAVSEGARDKDGKYISEYGSNLAAAKDSFGHAQMGGLAATLAAIVKEKTGAKVRGIEFSLIQRCAAHIASGTDIAESYLAGQAAVEHAVAGVTGKMTAFARPKDGPYRCDIVLVDLKDVANTEKKIPREWINADGNGLLPAFSAYALPLIQGETGLPKADGLPRFAKLKKIKA
jgi:6-phosphofructokinase 1